MKLIKLLKPLLAIVFIGCASLARAQAPLPPEIAARQYILIDLNSNQVLAERDADAQAEPASLTKLMTAYIVFNAIRDKKLALDQKLPISVRAWDQRKRGGSLMFIDTTMTPTVAELMRGMIVQSGNDASVALAEAVGGSVENFVAMMNRQALAWGLKNTGWGLKLRMVGDSADAARALGSSVTGVRVAATTAGGFIAGLGGASLSLHYPGSWNEGLSSGQGLIAVALVIFARWHPVKCLWAALLFGGAGALGPALQSVGIGGYYHLFNAVPYVLTLAILVWACSPRQSLRGAPMELGVSK